MHNNKPNILIIYTDQQSCWTLSCYGGIVDTPNIDRLANEGVLFDNYFTNSAVCTPSRGCFLTGRYPHQHGAYRNDVPINRDEITLAHILKENGYDTSYFGKWHLAGGESEWVENLKASTMGFDETTYMHNKGNFKKIIETNDGLKVSSNVGDNKTYSTDFLTNKAIEYIKTKKDFPFFF